MFRTWFISHYLWSKHIHSHIHLQMLVAALSGIVNSTFGVCSIKRKFSYLFLIVLRSWPKPEVCLHAYLSPLPVYNYVHTSVCIYIYIIYTHTSFSIYVHICFYNKFISCKPMLLMESLFLWIKDTSAWFLKILFCLNSFLLCSCL